MVVGGYNPDDSPFNNVEIIDPSGQNTTCPLISDYQGYAEYSFVGTFIKYNAIICGGRHYSPFVYVDVCYSLTNQVT